MWLHRSLLLLFAALVAVALPISGQSAPPQTVSTDPNDWPMYNHDVRGTRFNSGEQTLSPSTVSRLSVRWVFPTAGDVYGTPAAVGDSVFAGDTSGTFYALSDSGQLIWQIQVNGPITASALVTSNMVFFGDQAGYVYVLDRTSGRIMWSIRPNPHPLAAIYGSPIWINGDIVIGVSSNEDSYAAANPGYPCCSFRGSVARASIWSNATYDAATNRIFVTTGNNYMAPASATSDAFIALDADSGNILWTSQRVAGDTQTFEADIGDSPQVYTVNGSTVVGAGEKYTGIYWVINASDGTIVGQNQAVPSCPGSEGLFADSAVADGVVVVNGVNCNFYSNPPLIPPTGEVVALTPDAQSRLWDFTSLHAPVLSGVAIANGVAYFESSDPSSTLYAVKVRNKGEKFMKIAALILFSVMMMAPSPTLFSAAFQKDTRPLTSRVT